MTDAELLAGIIANAKELQARLGHADCCEPAPEPPAHPEPPAPSGWIKADSITPIDFTGDINAHLGDAAPHIVYAKSKEVVGAFRFNAEMSHLSYDDPIVHPGRPGAAHLHHFFGNRTTDAFSTYESLRANPESTTNADVINGSAYWLPALLDGKGNVVNPKSIQIYYKSRPQANPSPPEAIGVGFPAGMRFVMNERASFRISRGGSFIQFLSGPALAPILDAAQVGDEISFVLTSRQFWDGEHIDSPDHKSHLSAKYSPDFPYYMPEIALIPVYDVQPGDDPKLWRFSSDGDAPAGSTLHADYFEAWEPSIRETWQELVIDGHLSTSNAHLGNRKTGKWWAGRSEPKPHLIPVPPHPGGHSHV